MLKIKLTNNKTIRSTNSIKVDSKQNNNNNNSSKKCKQILLKLKSRNLIRSKKSNKNNTIEIESCFLIFGAKKTFQ